MDAELKEYKRCILVKVDGRIDGSNAQDFQSVMENLTDDGKFKLVLDMTDISFISSRGWWVLVQTQKVCKRYNRGELVLANIKEDIRDSLDLVGLNLYFKIFDDTTGAVAYF
jgi:anti-sigma B factor antagonist